MTSWVLVAEIYGRRTVMKRQIYSDKTVALVHHSEPIMKRTCDRPTQIDQVEVLAQGKLD